MDRITQSLESRTKTATCCRRFIPVKKCKTTILTYSILLVLVNLFVTKEIHAYLITLDSGIENECFHERVPVGTKLGFSFEVIEGGFYDVDVEIKDPSNVVLHQEDRASNGKYTIEATHDGPYQFCFSNKRSSLAPKMIIFDIDKSDPTKKDTTQTAELDPNSEKGKEEGEVGKLVNMIDQLMLATVSARHDVRYLTARDRVHRKVNESTNRTIVWWSGLEFILLLSVTVGQVLYLKRFFEIRRKA